MVVTVVRTGSISGIEVHAGKGVGRAKLNAARTEGSLGASRGMRNWENSISHKHTQQRHTCELGAPVIVASLRVYCTVHSRRCFPLLFDFSRHVCFVLTRNIHVNRGKLEKKRYCVLCTQEGC